jgi:hypothetical protein
MKKKQDSWTVVVYYSDLKRAMYLGSITKAGFTCFKKPSFFTTYKKACDACKDIFEIKKSNPNPTSFFVTVESWSKEDILENEWKDSA